MLTLGRSIKNAQFVIKKVLLWMLTYTVNNVMLIMITVFWKISSKVKIVDIYVNHVNHLNLDL